MAWATPVSEDVKPVVGSSTLIIVYVALALGSSFCILARSTLLATTGFKTATMLFNKMHFCLFCAPMSQAKRILLSVSGETKLPCSFGEAKTKLSKTAAF
ncbi:hypothetical protein WN943_012428 [Citrus x changshan-huyou]